MGLDACLKHLVIIRSVVDVQILIRVLRDGFQSKNGTVCIQFLDLLEWECMDVAIHCNLLRKHLMLLSLGVYFEDAVVFALL